MMAGSHYTMKGDRYSSRAKVARLLRERMKEDIKLDALEKMTKMDESLLIRLSEPVGMIRGLVASKTAETIALIGAGEDDWPPCMRKIVGELAEGVNVNHFGRVFLGTMSRCIGLPQETTVDFFEALLTSVKDNHVPSEPSLRKRYTPLDVQN